LRVYSDENECQKKEKDPDSRIGKQGERRRVSDEDQVRPRKRQIAYRNIGQLREKSKIAEYDNCGYHSGQKVRDGNAD